MLTYSFDHKEWDEVGGMGWLIHGAPKQFNPVSGMGVAHDILEHHKDDTGELHNELMAFGAMYRVRGETGYWCRKQGYNTDPVFHMSNGILTIFDDACVRSEDPEVLRPFVGQVSTGNCNTDEELRHIAKEGARRVAEEYNDEDAYGFKLNSKDIQDTANWMIAGYCKNAERFKDVSTYALCDTFVQIEEQSDQLLNSLEDWQLATLTVVTDGDKVDITMKEEEEPFDDYDYDA